MDMLEMGVNSAVVTYGLIVVWTILARLRWLPRALVRGVRWPLDRLGRVPIIGRVVAVFRRHPLSLGLLIAILVGVAVPYAVVSMMWLIYALSFAVVAALGIWAIFNSNEEKGDMFPDANKLYYSRYDGNRMVPGYDVEADPDRPWL